MAGLGALAYILQGIGGVGEGLAANQEAARKQQLAQIEQQRADQLMELQQNQQALERERMAQQESQFGRTLSAQDAQRFIQVPASALPTGIAGGLPPDAQGLVKVPAAVMPTYEKMREAEVTQGRLDTLRQFLASRAGTPATAPSTTLPPEMNAPGLGNEAVAPQKITPEQLVPLLAGIPNTEGLAKYLLESAAQKYSLHGGSAAGVPIVRLNQATGETEVVAPGGTREPKTFQHEVPTAQGRFIVTTDDQGREIGRVRVGDLPPKEGPQPSTSVTVQQLTLAKQALLRNGVPPNDPRIKDLNEQLDNQKTIGVAPGGTAIGIGGGQVQTQAPLSPAEREKSATELSTLDLMDNVTKLYDPAFVGPARSGLAALAKRIPGSQALGLPGTTSQEAAFDKANQTLLAEINRSYVQGRFGPKEYELITKQLPTKGDQPNTWEAAMAQARQTLQGILARQGQVQQGQNLRNPPGLGQGGGGGWGKATVVNP